MDKIHIDADISVAATLPAAFYRSAALFEETKERILARCWHYLADVGAVAEPGTVHPLTLLPGVLDEPLVLTHHPDGTRYCLSNVCTHRGKIVAEQAGSARLLSCSYHGRCFRLDGTFKSMPGFEGVQDFPRPADDLHRLPLEEWLGMLFTSLQPAVPLAEMTAPIRERLGWLPFHELTFDAASSQDYEVEAHWALYCDNYLEGFHVPFVHPALNEALSLEEYAYEVFPYCNLQLGIAKAGEPCFDIPPGAADHGRAVYAYYWWLFPNLMLNFYPWGLSLNVVEPMSLTRTRVRFRTYYFGGHSSGRAASRIHETEMEDEAVVESVQRGVQSRFYDRGRFSATMEQGVHHFHGLVARF